MLTGSVVALHDADTSAFWGLATVIVIICSLPVTAHTGTLKGNAEVRESKAHE
jgi:hypothetical protein